MLAVLIYITRTVRRALRKFGRALSIIAETYREAQAIRRAMPIRSMED